MAGFTWAGAKTVLRPTDLVPSEDKGFIPLWKHFKMSEEDIAKAELEMLRDERNEKLKETDWVSGEDVPDTIKEVWFPYRQSLREITDKYKSLEDVVWPEKP